MKKSIVCLCAAALAVSISACGNQMPAGIDYHNSVLTGQVQAVTENTVTLQLGELITQRPEDGPPPGGKQGPGGGDMPDEAPFELNGMTTFAAGEETVTLTVSEEALTALAQVEAGDVVQAETNSSGEAVTLTILQLDGVPEGGPGLGPDTVEQGSAAFTLAVDGDYCNETYPSIGDDENALRVDGASVTLDNIIVEKSAGASSNVESGDFFGMNAALLATNGAEVTITNAHVTSSAQNGNGVFSYGKGTMVTISESVIETTADNSGGIQTTGGGTTNASNLTVATQGSSSAAIRSDRGGGIVKADGGTYTTNGLNSPAIYSTAKIDIKNAVLTANNSEALVIEGQNSIALVDCDVTGNMSATQGSSSDVNVHNVMLYQSISGDAETGASTFSMKGGSLTGNSGDLFYVTNTTSVIDLSDVELINTDPADVLLRIAGNNASRGWGNAGANGGYAAFTAKDQVLEGDIIVDIISALDFTLTGNSTFTGMIQIVENEETGTEVGNNAVVTIERDSTWTLTGNSTITSLDNQGTINFNGYTITLADGTVLKA